MSFRLIIVLALLTLFSANSFAEKIIVDKKHSLNSIKKAIEIAKPYDEIIINKGFYSESIIIIDKPLSPVASSNLKELLSKKS